MGGYSNARGTNKTMNIDALLKKILGGLSIRKRETCTPPLASPARDWELILLCAVVLISASALWASFMYVSVKRGPEVVGTEGFASARASQLNESGLARMLTLRSARAKLHEEYLNGL